MPAQSIGLCAQTVVAVVIVVVIVVVVVKSLKTRKKKTESHPHICRRMQEQTDAQIFNFI